ncbi:hypothetical protein ACQKOE_09950 [Novosphingobium sp. NPDC080210]|uniref:hypothetical protein n=1 Tax=Novosphingobium sp. NPDC080210 TaxID=3390596 RepID=UPI003D02C0C3
MTYEEAKQRFTDAGYTLIEDRDEVNNPVDYATGPHWHFVLGGGPEGQENPDMPEVGPPPTTAMANTAVAQPPQDEGSGFWRMPKSTDELLQGLKLGAGNIVEGLAGIPGIVVDPINVMASEALGTKRPMPLGDAAREMLGLPDDDSLSGDIQKGIAGGLGGAGAAKLISKATTGLASTAAAEFGATPIRDAVAGGGAAAGQRLAEDAGAGVLGQTGAAVLGGLAGYKAGGIPQAVSAEGRATRFATKEAAKNPFAAYDAEIAADISKATEGRAVSPRDPKGRAEITVKTLNNVEQSYYAQFADLLNRTDLDDVSKLKLKEAMTRKYSIPKEEVDALRGTVEGDAVADAITKVQRLRQLTPELKRNPGWIAQTAKIAAGAADVAPLFGLPGTYGAASVGVRAGLNKLGKITGDGEAARVHAAERLIKRNNAYSKLAGMVGPSGQRQSQQALWDKVEALSSEAELDDLFKSMDAESAAAAKEAAKLAREKEAAWNAKQKMEMGNQPRRTRSAQEEAAWRENERSKTTLSEAEKRRQEEAMWASVEPVPVPRGKVAEEEAGWRNILSIAQQRQAAKQAALKASAPKLDMTPPKPAPAPKPAKISPEDQAIEDAISKGIRGDSGVQNAFVARLGISPDDLPKVLDKIEQDLPDLAGEINRIRFNYPTKNRRIGSVLGGRMAAAADELGIPKAAAGGESPRPIPVDEAAQQRLAQTEAAPPPSYAQSKDEPAIKPVEGSTDQVELRGTVSSMEEAQQALDYQASQLGGDTVGSIDEMPDGTIVVSTVGQRQIRQIDRPQQWEQGKKNYQSAANAAMSDLYSDIRLGDGALNAIKRVPEKIRDQFKTTDEAINYVENEVVPDLQAAKVSGQEIDTIRSYLYEIAGSKPYATREAYEAGTKANPRGRPRKQAN